MGDVEKSNSHMVLPEVIEQKIFLIRGQKVMLDKHLAELYQVSTKALNQAVKRNIDRFPSDFMFVITWEEVNSLRSQFVTLNDEGPSASIRGKHIKYLPLAFTEQGIAMLSSVLNSKRAIHVNIQIMRTFTKLREMLMHHKDLKKKIEEMEKKYDHQFKVVFDAIRALLEDKEKPKAKIGFLRE